MLLKKINNTLEKSCVVMTKIRNGSIINAALAKKSHLWCHFIFLILTRTGLHTKNYLCQVVDLQCLIIVGARIRGVTVGLVSTRPVTALKKNHMSRYSCHMSGEAGQLNGPILMWLLTMKWKIEDEFWSSSLNPLHFANQFDRLRGPHLCCVPKVGPQQC